MRDHEELRQRSPNILYINFIGAVREKFGQQYCTICLDHDGAFKKEWRLSLMPICLKHKVLLRDRCPHCEKPIYLTKSTSFLKDLRFCTFCWNSLITPPQLIPDSQLKFFKSISCAINSGWFSFNELEMYAPLFFKGVWRIIYSFYGTKGRKKKTWDKVCNFYNISQKPLTNTQGHNPFNDETPEQRLLILDVVERMISNWPTNMVQVSNHAGITLLVLNLSRSGLPYWIQKTAESELNKNWYKVSLEEFESALIYMASNNIEINKSGVARTLGLDISRKYNLQEYKLFQSYKKLQRM